MARRPSAFANPTNRHKKTAFSPKPENYDFRSILKRKFAKKTKIVQFTKKAELSPTRTFCQPNCNAKWNTRRILRQFRAWHSDDPRHSYAKRHLLSKTADTNVDENAAPKRRFVPYIIQKRNFVRS